VIATKFGWKLDPNTANRLAGQPAKHSRRSRGFAQATQTDVIDLFYNTVLTGVQSKMWREP